MQLFTDVDQAMASLSLTKNAPLSAEVVEDVIIRLEEQQRHYLLTYYPRFGERPEHWLLQLPEDVGQYMPKEPLAPTVEAALTKWLLQRWVVVDGDMAITLAEGLCALGLSYLCLYHPVSPQEEAHFEFRKPEYQGALLF
ncbi:hypothetical protein GTO89_05880 [Heliobacterium gestii]|uniref:Uncharacterized protein n=1 Tax=Heliomicrobium gestii TaxID=2699 RepID=A0A845LDN3_HELGE|nr:hypothetical protein [Heliomicrobium gestii]MBM7866108.1 hypothetical protein [Heliomicrobium gestii]MZP42565.1 hypothetical protein [Heliomicrobium gestii]